MSILKRLRKTITLDAFCVGCGIANGSVEFAARQTGRLARDSDTVSMAAAFTVEINYKTISSFATKGIIFGNYRTLNSDYNVEIGFLNSKVVVRVLKTASYTTITSTQNYSQGEWGHLAVTYDGTTVKIYLDGVLDSSTGTVAAPLDSSANTVHIKSFGTDEAGTGSLFVGFLSEYKLWSRALLGSEIRANMNKRRGLNNELLQYTRFNESTAVGGATRFLDYIDNTKDITEQSAGDISQSTDEYPALKLGASFVAARYSITSPNKFSFKYPCVKPSGANFMLVVAYLDDDNNFQRYKLWDQDGVVMWPVIERYRGQVISEDFWLEVWNVDGAETCELEDEYILYTSKMTIPGSERDASNEEVLDDNPTLDNTIFESFPLTPFPLQFADDGFGTCSTPVEQDTDNMSTNLTLYGGAQI